MIFGVVVSNNLIWWDSLEKFNLVWIWITSE